MEEGKRATPLWDVSPVREKEGEGEEVSKTSWFCCTTFFFWTQARAGVHKKQQRAGWEWCGRGSRVGLKLLRSKSIFGIQVSKIVRGSTSLKEFVANTMKPPRQTCEEMKCKLLVT
jgi:hypothetical protein